MREWVQEISEYMQGKEAIQTPLDELSEEIYQAALEAEMLLELTHELESVYSNLVGKIENGK